MFTGLRGVVARNPPETEKPRFYWGFRGFLWWPRPGSNRRHTDFQSVALPTELPSHDQLVVNGRSRGIRTHDPVIKSHLLYQLSYAPIHRFHNPMNGAS